MLKTLKRKIALVAVSVLGASGLAVVAAPSANAASYTGGTIAFSGVRVTKSDGTNLDAVPFAKATITIPCDYCSKTFRSCIPYGDTFCLYQSA